MSTQLTDSCTTYLACMVGMTKGIDWMTVGAVVLLVARLIKDVPDAIVAINAMYKKYKEKRNDKGKR